MSDRESGDEQSQVAQRGVHLFASCRTVTVSNLSAALLGARLHSCCEKQTSIACCFGIYVLPFCSPTSIIAFIFF